MLVMKNKIMHGNSTLAQLINNQMFVILTRVKDLRFELKMFNDENIFSDVSIFNL